MLDYKLIEALAMVLAENGFDRAAKKLHITQSAVSQRIRMLEDQSGQVLLARTTPVRATTAGLKMIQHYNKVKRLEDDLEASFTPPGQDTFSTLPIGINDDSLATWFFSAVCEFLYEEKILLDLRKEDQEQTHRLLKNGEVMGCISSMERAMQGCRVTYLGSMAYHMVATKEFTRRWFSDGVTIKTLKKAPFLRFNRRDQLHIHYFKKVFKKSFDPEVNHYFASTERFVDFISNGLAYGLLLDSQCLTLLSEGRLVELIPHTPIAVSLYWHCWNLKSPLLIRFSQHLVKKAQCLLAQ